MDVLADLEERRQQLDMLVRWRDELQNLHADTVQAIAARITQRGGLGLSDTGLADVKKWLKKYELSIILRAVDEAFDNYLVYTDNRGGITIRSWETAFEKIPRIARVMTQEKTKPYLSRLFYIQGIIRRRVADTRYTCIDYLEQTHVNGMGLDELELRAKRMQSLEDFQSSIDAWFRAF